MNKLFMWSVLKSISGKLQTNNVAKVSLCLFLSMTIHSQSSASYCIYLYMYPHENSFHLTMSRLLKNIVK